MEAALWGAAPRPAGGMMPPDPPDAGLAQSASRPLRVQGNNSPVSDSFAALRYNLLTFA